MENESPVAKEELRLAARIVLAMKSVGTVAKEGRNKDQGYTYQKAADIFEAAQNAFVEHGICLLADEMAIEWPEPLMTASKSTMYVCRATMCYTLEDILSGEQKTIRSTGIGYDMSDKALNKAKTMAEKYFLKQMLLIGEEEDDADLVTPEETRQPACPVCGVVGSIRKGRPEFGGGWYCNKKAGGCGANFQDKPAIAADTKKQETKEPDKRPENPPKSQNGLHTAPPPKSGPGADSEATANGSESLDLDALDECDKMEQELAELRQMVEKTKMPGGWEKWGTLMNRGKPQQRVQLRQTLIQRQKLIDEGKLQV